jgi:hypothetical protein
VNDLVCSFEIIIKLFDMIWPVCQFVCTWVYMTSNRNLKIISNIPNEQQITHVWSIAIESFIMWELAVVGMLRWCYYIKRQRTKIMMITPSFVIHKCADNVTDFIAGVFESRSNDGDDVTVGAVDSRYCKWSLK